MQGCVVLNKARAQYLPQDSFSNKQSQTSDISSTKNLNLVGDEPRAAQNFPKSQWNVNAKAFVPKTFKQETFIDFKSLSPERVSVKEDSLMASASAKKRLIGSSDRKVDRHTEKLVEEDDEDSRTTQEKSTAERNVSKSVNNFDEFSSCSQASPYTWGTPKSEDVPKKQNDLEDKIKQEKLERLTKFRLYRKEM